MSDHFSLQNSYLFLKRGEGEAGSWSSNTSGILQSQQYSHGIHRGNGICGEIWANQLSVHLKLYCDDCEDQSLVLLLCAGVQPIPSQGGKLEIAGTVVGHWAGSRRGRGGRGPFPLQVVSVGGPARG